MAGGQCLVRLVLTVLSGSPLKRSDSQHPVEGRSANHFEVAFTEFEFLLDFGQAYDTVESPLVHTRIIMAPTAAKMLCRMLDHILAQYESEIAPIRQGGA
jgi:hypothetical protein